VESSRVLHLRRVAQFGKLDQPRALDALLRQLREIRIAAERRANLRRREFLADRCRVFVADEQERRRL
jgi:hypothetical protein